jgi:hypothetical protein
LIYLFGHYLISFHFIVSISVSIYVVEASSIAETAKIQKEIAEAEVAKHQEGFVKTAIFGSTARGDEPWT